jgi:hypothetical protein
MITKWQETTDWGDVPVVNGIYHLNAEGHLVAYETPKNGLKIFSKPMKRFSKARRKFEKVGEYPDPTGNDVKSEDDENTWTFTGSKGDTYVVQNDGGIYRCSCPGFKYRGRCKHSDEVIANGPGGQAPAWQ